MQFNGEKVFSINGAGTIGHPFEKINLDTGGISLTKITQTGLQK